MQVATHDPVFRMPGGNPLVASPPPPSKLPHGECLERFAPMDAALQVELPREEQSTLRKAHTRACQLTFIKEQQVFDRFGYPDLETMCQKRYLNGQSIKRSTGYEHMPLARLPASWIEEAGDRVTVRNALAICKGEREPASWVMRLVWEGLLAGCKLSGARRIAAVVAEAIKKVDAGQTVPTEAELRQLIEHARLGTPEDRVDELTESLDDTLKKVLRDSGKLKLALAAVTAEYGQDARSPLQARRAEVIAALLETLGEVPSAQADPASPDSGPDKHPDSGQDTGPRPVPATASDAGAPPPKPGPETAETSGEWVPSSIAARLRPGVSASIQPLIDVVRAVDPSSRICLITGLSRVVAGQPLDRVKEMLHETYEYVQLHKVPREVAAFWMSLLTEGEWEERGCFALWFATKIGDLSLPFYLARLRLEDLPSGLAKEVKALLSDDSPCFGWNTESRKRPYGKERLS